MATSPNKSANVSLLAWQDVSTGDIVISSASDVGTVWGASFGIRIGRKSGTAFTTGWPNIRIEGSTKASGNNSWIPLFIYQPQPGATIANTTLSAGLSGGETSFGVASASNIAVGDILFLADSSASNYEIVRVKSVVSTTITPEEAIVNAHANAAQVTDQAEMTFPAIDLTPYVRVRAVADNGNSGVTMAVEVLMTTFDSFG
jgi:hypothetical protein